jgi:hypothetical protein
VNREGKSYRSERVEPSRFVNSVANGSIIVVTRSEKWSPGVADEQSNYTQICLVLECPMDPKQVGREVRLDERKYVYVGKLLSTWDADDRYVEI